LTRVSETLPQVALNPLSLIVLTNYLVELCAKEIEADASKELLDAQKIDVYRGTNAVIVTISPFSIESLEYAR
jgi:translation initiation factor 6 (eIF-6)